MAAKQADAAPFPPIEAASTLTAFARRRASREAPSASRTVSVPVLAARSGSAAAARSDAGLVSSSKQVERVRVQTRWYRRFSGVSHAR
jgi:hypothetical protein